MTTDSILKILIFLSGLILGHWLAIGRDRRKEYNEIADIVSHKLRKKKEGATQKLVWNGPSEDEFQDLLRRVPFWQIKGLNKAIDTYCACISSNNYSRNKYGEVFFIDEKSIVNSIDFLLKYSKRR